MKRTFWTKVMTLVSLATLGMVILSGCEDNTANITKEANDSQTNNSAIVSEIPPTDGGTVVVGIQQDIDSLDPHKATAAGTKEILFNIFEGLVKPDENGNLYGAVASDYTVSEDGLTYTFTLREGVKFHNGETVSARDVKYSLERVSGILDGTALISSLSTIESVEIADEKTVVVTVSGANTELIYSFTAAIIPEGSGEDENATPIGTGPFKFESYTPQVGMKVSKNEEYWKEGLPYLDAVEFKIVTSKDTSLLELQGGSIDIYPYLTDSQIAAIPTEFDVISGASDVVQALFLNNDYEPFKKKEVRQAICYALDKNMISEFVAGGRAELIGSAMLPTLTDYYTDTNDAYGTYADTEKAKELLAEAGYPNGFKLAIMVPSNYEYHMETAEVILESLKAVGIDASIDAVPWETWLSECYTNRNYEATVCGITCDLTPGYLMNRFESTAKKNFINFKSAEYDNLVAKAKTGISDEEKQAVYKEMQEVLTAEAGTAFIQAPPINIAIKRALHGYKIYPVYVQDMSTVYYGE